MLLASSGFLSLVVVAVWLFAVFDAVTCPEDRIRGLQKPLWILIVLLGFIFGAVAWFALGKVRAGASARTGAFGGRPGTDRLDPSASPADVTRFGGPRRARPIAPDDDIDWLRSINRPKDENGPS